MCNSAAAPTLRRRCATAPNGWRSRTALVLVTDFCEGGPPSELVRAVKKRAEARVKLLGLASLDSQAHPVCDRQTAESLAACGMEIAALTPQKLAHWLVKVIS